MNNITAKTQQGFFSPIYTVRDTIYDGIQTGIQTGIQATQATTSAIKSLDPYKSVNNVFNQTTRSVKESDNILMMFINSFSFKSLL
jgi:hypothetical protein